MIRIITTEDGSQSLYNEQLNETYHSTHGALTESRHVFIRHGLDYLKNLGKKRISILEVGFGTGLNALLVQEYCENIGQVDIEYVTLEPYPVSPDILAELNYHKLIGDRVSKSDFEKLHNCSWADRHKLTSNFTFSKYLTTLQKFETNQLFDLVFYDAFAPGKQSEMWQIDTLKRAVDLMCNEAVLVTYCAKGQFKRDLKGLGLDVESLPGPPGKHEMVRAIKP